MGPILIFMGYLTMIQGLQIFSIVYYGSDLKKNLGPPASIKFGYAVIGIFAAFFLGAYLLEKYRFVTSPPTPSKEGPQEEQAREEQA